MRIGILTFHNCINHGAYLQSFALQKRLEELGYTNVIINYKSWKYTINEYLSFFHKRNPVKTFRNILKIYKFKKELRFLKKTERVFNSKKLTRYNFDAVFIGSDSVFNYTNDLSGFDKTYFSENLKAERIISYAASFGPDTFGNDYPKELPLLFERFQHIGVRDSNSENFVNSISNKKAKIVLDPTFLYDFKPSEIILPKEKDYILIYSLGLEEDQIESVKKIAKRNNKKIISIGYKNEWCDINYIAVSPLEWVGYFSKADFIVTSMFHGTIFCIKYNKNFATVVTKYRANKLNDLLVRIGLDSRIVTEANDIEKLASRNIDFDIINKLLKIEKEKSENFLINALNS